MLRRRRQLHTQVQKLLDAFLFGLSFFLAHWFRTWPGLDPEHKIADFSSYAPYLLMVVPLAPAILELQGFYQRAHMGARRQTLWQLSRAAAWMALLVVAALFLRKEEGARGVVALFIPLVIFLVWIKEEIIRHSAMSIGGEAGRRRVIFVGADADARQLEQTLGTGALGGVQLVARLDLNRDPIGRLVDLLHEHSANAVIVSPRNTLFGTIEEAIHACELEGVEVWLFADFFKTRLAQTTVDELAGHPMLVFATGPRASWHSVAKGVLDFVGALVLVALTSWLMVLAAIAVRLSSPGPVMFRQRRAGLNGRPFGMLKFRSMVSNAEQLKQELAALNEMTGPVFKVTNDPRVTRVGRILRKWSLDELPQLFNVLRGEMSLVGPRPLPLDEVARFDDPAHRRRLSVKPGLTCLWQISGRNDVRDFTEWVRLDLEYIDNWSIWLDVEILLRTVPAVFSGAGAK